MEKKKMKDGIEPRLCLPPMIIFLREGRLRKPRRELVEVRIARFPLREQDDTRRGGTWDLIYAPWKWQGCGPGVGRIKAGPWRRGDGRAERGIWRA